MQESPGHPLEKYVPWVVDAADLQDVQGPTTRQLGWAAEPTSHVCSSGSNTNPNASTNLWIFQQQGCDAFAKIPSSWLPALKVVSVWITPSSSSWNQLFSQRNIQIFSCPRGIALTEKIMRKPPLNEAYGLVCESLICISAALFNTQQIHILFDRVDIFIKYL